jgi:ABC-2 type transport system permease protein
LRAGLTAQFVTLARSPNSLLALATMPLTTVLFVGAVLHAGRADLVGHALVAPVLMAQWAMALLVAGELVDTERWQGTLELVVASPTSFPVMLAGRVLAVTTIGLVSFAEAAAVATLGFGLDVRIGDPGGFLLAAVATTFAVAGWATVLASALVLARNVRVLQNTLTFPIYLLGGVLVPVSFLPEPLRWLSRGVFLSWSADLLRATYASAAVPGLLPRVGVLVAFGSIGFLLGHGLLAASLRSLRSTGRLRLT